MRKASGFTLIELMIVIAIVGILSAVALPILLRSRIAAHEASVIGALRTINTAQQQYRVQSARFGNLTQLHATNLVDMVIGSGTKAGFTFVLLVQATGETYSIRAFPQVVGVSGSRHFYTNSSAVLFVGDDPAVDSTSSPLD